MVQSSLHKCCSRYNAKRKGLVCCKTPQKGANDLPFGTGLAQSHPSLMSCQRWGSCLAAQRTSQCEFLGKHSPSSFLSLISAHQECKHQSCWRASHEAAPSPGRAEGSREAVQLLWQRQRRQRARHRLGTPSSRVQLGFASQQTARFTCFLQPRGEFCFISQLAGSGNRKVGEKRRSKKPLCLRELH